MAKKNILLKITGNILKPLKEKGLDTIVVKSIAQQIKKLKETHQFSLVIGGGNFFRGNIEGKSLGLDPIISHQVGMLATTMNGLVIKDVFEKNGVPSIILSANQNFSVCDTINQNNIEKAMELEKSIIFTGGTGNPFFSTDTAAILRALQIKADQVWKGTNVEGIFSVDPKLEQNAELLKKITFKQVIEKKIGIMDQTSFVLASENGLSIRVFNIFEQDSILKVCHNDDFGSLVY